MLIRACREELIHLPKKRMSMVRSQDLFFVSAKLSERQKIFVGLQFIFDQNLGPVFSGFGLVIEFQEVLPIFLLFLIDFHSVH